MVKPDHERRLDEAKTPKERELARDAHFQRMVNVEKKFKNMYGAGVSSRFDLMVAGYFRREAKRVVEAGDQPKVGPPAGTGSSSSAVGMMMGSIAERGGNQSKIAPPARSGSSPNGAGMMASMAEGGKAPSGPNPGENGIGQLENKSGVPAAKAINPAAKTRNRKPSWRYSMRE